MWQEASVARREHMLALHREYLQLQALSPAEASGWQEKREERAAKGIQQKWRSRSNRRSLLEVVNRTRQHRRAKAATTIQRTQRTRQRVVAEAAPPVTREMIDALQADVVERTLRMTRELSDARAKQASWRAAGGEQAAAGPAGDPSTIAPPPLPRWLEAPEWEQDLASQPPGGAKLVHELREAAKRGLHAEHPSAEQVAAVRDWPRLRGQMQGAAVRRQVARTQSAALFAQLRFPPKLPPAPPLSAVSLTTREGDSLSLPPIMPSKPAVLATHRRMLREQRLKLEVELGPEEDDEQGEAEAKAAAAAAEAAVQESAAAVKFSFRGPDAPSTPRGTGAAAAAPPVVPPSPATAAVLERMMAGGVVTAGGELLPPEIVQRLSSAELIWIASLQPA